MFNILLLLVVEVVVLMVVVVVGRVDLKLPQDSLLPLKDTLSLLVRVELLEQQTVQALTVVILCLVASHLLEEEAAAVVRRVDKLATLEVQVAADNLVVEVPMVVLHLLLGKEAQEGEHQPLEEIIQLVVEVVRRPSAELQQIIRQQLEMVVLELHHPFLAHL